MATREEIGTTIVAGEAQVFLQPIAAPSILGFFAFGGATFILSAWMVGWFGTALSTIYLAPFAAVFGGGAQLLAGMWAYRARDGVATAIHGTWGSFFIAYGLLQVLFIARPALIPPGLQFQELGFWFIVVAAVSWVTTLAAMAQRRALAMLLACVSAGATFEAIALLTGTMWCNVVGGYLLMLSSFIAIYDATAQVLKEVYGREVLKMGFSEKVLQEPDIMIGAGEPGVIHGQR